MSKLLQQWFLEESVSEQQFNTCCPRLLGGVRMSLLNWMIEAHKEVNQ